MIDWMQFIVAAVPAGEQAPRQPLKDMIWLFLLIGIAFYFIILRPQNRERQEKQKMLETAEKGDRVVTIGGIHGTVASVDQTKNTIHVDIGKNTKIEFSRNAISTVEKKGKKSGEQDSQK